MVTTKTRLQKLAGIITEAYQTGGKRSWNKVMKMIQSADEKGLVQDLGPKTSGEGPAAGGLPVHAHEFIVDGTSYNVIASEDLKTLQQAYEALMDSDHPMGLSWD